LAEELRRAGRFGLRVIPDNSATVRAGVVGLAFATTPRAAWYVPLGHVNIEPQRQVEPQAADRPQSAFDFADTTPERPAAASTAAAGSKGAALLAEEQPRRVAFGVTEALA